MTRIDPAQLATWFDAHAAGLVLYARQWLGRPAAEDVVQEVFVRLLDQPRAPANVPAWLYVSVRRAALTAGRSTRRRLAHERAAGGGGSPLFDARPGDRLDAAAAEAGLGELPPGDREIVVLRVWGGMTLAEVAGVTGSAASTVHDRYRAALSQLRARMRAGAAAVVRGRGGVAGRSRNAPGSP